MEDWKDRIMNSLEGLERAQPPADSFEKIQRTIAKQQSKAEELSGRAWLSIAAAILLVVSANAFTVFRYLQTDQPVASEESYPELISSFNIYEE